MNFFNSVLGGFIGSIILLIALSASILIFFKDPEADNEYENYIRKELGKNGKP